MTDPSEEMKPFLSLSQMRQAHAELLKQTRSGLDEKLSAQARMLIERGAATGMILDEESERRAAQNLLDYWYTNLLTAGFEPPDATLAPLDPEQFPDLSDVEAPYIGLDAFRANQQANFFGRDRLTSTIINRLADQRLLAVLGPSGSGKSSLVMAGVMPALAAGALPGSQDWTYLPRVVPGSEILQSLVRAVAGGRQLDPAEVASQAERLSERPARILELLREHHRGRPVVLLIDQFEEAFTLCLDVVKTQAYLDALLAVVGSADIQAYVLLTMRTDFEEHIARYPAFQSAFEKASFHLTPLSAREMREAIEKPAERINLRFEAGIVDALIHDILGEQAALPLLQFSLLKLWEKRKRNRITWDAYKAVGGGRRALQISADEFYDSLIVEDQQAVKQIFLKLVTPGEGLEVTGKRIRRVGLYTKSVASDRIDRVLESLVEARLIRLTPATNPEDEQVEVAHEALIRNWPALVGWVEEARVELRQRRRLTRAADEWQKLGQDPNALWSGIQLQRVLDYEDLSPLEQKFVEASLDKEKSEMDRELEQARRLAEEQERRAESERLRAEEAAEAGRKLRSRAIFAIAALVTAAIFSIMALSSYSEAQQAETARSGEMTAQAGLQAALAGEESARLAQGTAEAAVATAAAAFEEVEAGKAAAETAATLVSQALATANAAFETAQAERQRANTFETLALARQYAADAEEVLSADPGLALLLALESLHKARTADGLSILLAGLSPNTGFQIEQQTYQRDAESRFHRSLDFDATGTLIVAGLETGVIEIWKLNGTIERSLIEHQDRVLDVDFDPKNERFASSDAEGRILLWDAGDFSKVELENQSGNLVFEVAFSPDGNLLAASLQNDNIQLYDLTQEGNPLVFEILRNPQEYFTSLVWSPDSSRLAAGNNFAQLRIWDIDLANPDINQRAVTGSPLSPGEDHFQSLDWVSGLEINGQAREVLISGHATGKIIFWDADTGSILLELEGHTNRVYAVDVSWDNSFMISGGSDYTAILWELENFTPLEVYSTPAWVLAAGFSPTERRFVISSSGDLLIYQIVEGEQLGAYRDSQLDRIDTIERFSDGAVYFGVLEGNTTRFFDEGGGEIRSFQPDPEALATAYAPLSGHLLQVYSGWQVNLLSSASEIVRTIDISPHEGVPGMIAVSPDETTIAIAKCSLQQEGDDTACEASTVYFFDFATGAASGEISVQGGVTAMTVHPNGQTAIATDGGAVILGSSGSDVTRNLPAVIQSTITRLDFSPDAALLASGDNEGNLILWDTASEKPISGILSKFPGPFTGLVFSADGNSLYTANQAGALYIWDVSLESWKQKACESANRNFTEAELDRYFPNVNEDKDEDQPGPICPVIP